MLRAGSDSRPGHIAFDAAIRERDDAIASIRQARVVSDQQHSAAELPVELAKKMKDLGG